MGSKSFATKVANKLGLIFQAFENEKVLAQKKIKYEHKKIDDKTWVEVEPDYQVYDIAEYYKKALLADKLDNKITPEIAQHIVSNWNGEDETFIVDGSLYCEHDVQEAEELLTDSDI